MAGFALLKRSWVNRIRGNSQTRPQKSMASLCLQSAVLASARSSTPLWLGERRKDTKCPTQPFSVNLRQRRPLRPFQDSFFFNSTVYTMCLVVAKWHHKKGGVINSIWHFFFKFEMSSNQRKYFLRPLPLFSQTSRFPSTFSFMYERLWSQCGPVVNKQVENDRFPT